MSDQRVIYEKNGRLARITLNRPESLNAIDGAMDAGLKAALNDFDMDEELWVAILCGNGRSFCAGADIRGSGPPPTTSRVAHYYLEFPINWKPVIAAVHGHVYGAGLILAAESDVIVATEDAKFAIVETKHGMPAVTLFAQLAPWMGSKRLTEMILTGEPLSAQEAYQRGLVNRLVPTREELLPAAEELANKIVANPPIAVRTAVQLARTSAQQSKLHQDAATILRNCGWTKTEDYAEGRRAFREKRKPVYRGR